MTRKQDIRQLYENWSSNLDSVKSWHLASQSGIVVKASRFSETASVLNRTWQNKAHFAHFELMCKYREFVN